MSDPRSPFHWAEEVRPSIFWTEAGERNARKLAKQGGGMALDVQGRALVSMDSHANQSIVITSQSAADKTARIKYGALI